MLTILLTRHGIAAPSNVMLGAHLDPPLESAGRVQAEALGTRLADVRIDRVLSSPMKRAYETAVLVAGERPIEIDDRLTELDYGEWEGLTYEEIEARDPVKRAIWEADPARSSPPAGERAEHAAKRVRSLLEDLLDWSERDPGTEPPPGESPAGDGPRVLIVAHGALNRILLCAATDNPISAYRRRYTQDRVNLTVLHYSTGAAVYQARLVLLNDISHLKKPGETPWD